MSLRTWDQSQKVDFGSQNWIFNFWGVQHVHFSSITHFLGHKFQDPSCRICSYGPYGPFCFSVKNVRIWKHVTKNAKIGKSHFLRLSGKWINSSGVSSQKLSYVYEAPAGAFISAKLTFLGISDIPILEKVCISSYLGFPFHLWKGIGSRWGNVHAMWLPGRLNVDRLRKTSKNLNT